MGRRRQWELGEPVSLDTAKLHLKANRASLQKAVALGYIRGTLITGKGVYATPDAWREGWEAYLKRDRKEAAKRRTKAKRVIEPAPCVGPETARRRLEALTPRQRQALQSFIRRVIEKHLAARNPELNQVLSEVS